MDRSRSWFDPKRLSALASRAKVASAARPSIAPIPAPAPAPAAAVERRDRPASPLSDPVMKLFRSEIVRGSDAQGSLRQIANVTADALGADRASVWILDSERTRLVRAAGADRQNPGKNEAISVADAPGYFRALRDGDAIVADDVSVEPRLAELRDRLRSEDVASLVDVPVLVNGRHTGLVRVEHLRDPHTFSKAEEQFLRDVALIAAMPLQAAERRREQEERERAEARLRRNHAALMTLARSESLSRGALDESLREITETASEILATERSSVWVYNADQTSILCLELFQRSKRAHESGVELKSEAFPGYFRALREERTISAHDAHSDPRTREFSEVYLTPLGINSMLDAPIRVGGRMIGVICNEHIGPSRKWTVEEEQFAGSLADFIALAMESNQRKETETQLRTMLQEYENLGG